MRRVPSVDLPLKRFGSSGVRIHHPTSGPETLLRSDGPATLVVANLEQGGVIGAHPATGNQLIVVGSGLIEERDGNGAVQSFAPGEAVLIDAGEEHETRAVLASVISIMEWKA